MAPPTPLACPGSAKNAREDRQHVEILSRHPGLRAPQPGVGLVLGRVEPAIDVRVMALLVSLFSAMSTHAACVSLEGGNGRQLTWHGGGEWPSSGTSGRHFSAGRSTCFEIRQAASLDQSRLRP